MEAVEHALRRRPGSRWRCRRPSPRRARARRRTGTTCSRGRRPGPARAARRRWSPRCSAARRRARSRGRRARTSAAGPARSASAARSAGTARRPRPSRPGRRRSAARRRTARSAAAMRGASSATSRPPGKIARPVSSADQPRSCCMYSVAMNWKPNQPPNSDIAPRFARTSVRERKMPEPHERRGRPAARADTNAARIAGDGRERAAACAPRPSPRRAPRRACRRAAASRPSRSTAPATSKRAVACSGGRSLSGTSRIAAEQDDQGHRRRAGRTPSASRSRSAGRRRRARARSRSRRSPCRSTSALLRAGPSAKRRRDDRQAGGRRERRADALDEAGGDQQRRRRWPGRRGPRRRRRRRARSGTCAGGRAGRRRGRRAAGSRRSRARSALTTHCSELVDMSRSVRIEGSATPIIETSSASRKSAPHSTSSAPQARALSRSAPPSSDGDWGVVKRIAPWEREGELRSEPAYV